MRPFVLSSLLVLVAMVTGVNAAVAKQPIEMELSTDELKEKIAELPIEVAPVAYYQLNVQYGGHEINLAHEDILFYEYEWADGPFGCTHSAIQLFGRSNSFFHIHTPTHSLTFQRVMSFFIYLNYASRAKGGPIMLYEPARGMTPGISFQVTSTNALILYFNDPTGAPLPSVVTPPGVVSPDGWHHVGFTCYGRHYTFWVDGQQVYDEAFAPSLSGKTDYDDIRFGHSFQQDFFEAKMACAAFYDVVLDAPQISYLMSKCDQCSSPTECNNDANCNCYVDICYDVGLEYCDRGSCARCSDPERCCCETKMKQCTHDRACTCIDERQKCSDEGLEYCHPSKCEGHCDGLRCCCPPEDLCPVWSECHCMQQPCSDIAELHDCDRCCSDCPFGHCCCCDHDWKVCATTEQCHCEDQACDQIPGYGYCDPSRCNLAHSPIDDATVVWNRYLHNYQCPNDQCCCKSNIITAYGCADASTCQCETQECSSLGREYCECDHCPDSFCCCDTLVKSCPPDDTCVCMAEGKSCLERGLGYCSRVKCHKSCDGYRCCCQPQTPCPGNLVLNECFNGCPAPMKCLERRYPCDPIAGMCERQCVCPADKPYVLSDDLCVNEKQCLLHVACPESGNPPTTANGIVVTCTSDADCLGNYFCVPSGPEPWPFICCEQLPPP